MNCASEWESRISEFRKTLNSLSEAARKYMTPFLNRAETYMAQFRSGNIYIALIGVTSSGKSTLLNTLLGEDELLPSQIMPCSSRQVTCQRGTILQMQVNFSEESGRAPETVTGRECIREALRHYGSEGGNPGNCLCVSSLDVFSPNFLFDPPVVFVDTPGLDAAGLKEHERVTLEQVLPSVHMVMFVVTTESDSDQKNLECIDEATSDGKPLIVVQNKIDSVAPFITRDLSRNKDVPTLLNEHRKRVKDVLSHAQKQSVRDAPIIQISALEKRNIDSLKRVTEVPVCHADESRVSLFFKRMSAIAQEQADELQEMLSSRNILTKKQASVNQAQKALEYLQQTTLQELQKLQKIWHTIEVCYLGLLQKMVRLAPENASFTASSLEELSSRPFAADVALTETVSSAIRDLEAQTVTLVRRLYTTLSKTLCNIRSQTENTCRCLGITDNVWSLDFVGSAHSSCPTETFSHDNFRGDETDRGHWEHLRKEKTRRIRRNADGELASVARNLGDLFGEDSWGRETVSVPVRGEVPVFQPNPDRETLRLKDLIFRHIQRYLNRRSDCRGALNNFRTSLENAWQLIEDELNDRRQELAAQNYGNTVPDDELRRIRFILRSLAAVGRKYTEVYRSKVASVTPALPEQPGFAADIPKWVMGVLSLAETYAVSVHRQIAKALVRESRQKAVYICGWDIDRLRRFRSLYFDNSTEVRIICFSETDGALPTAPGLVFLLVHTGQIGSIGNKLFAYNRIGSQWQASSAFLKDAAVGGRIVWVADGIAAALNAGISTLTEALAGVVRLSEQLSPGTPPYDFLTSSRNLAYTLLFRELYSRFVREDRDRGLMQREALLRDLSNICKMNQTERLLFSDLIRSFCEHNTY